MVFLLLGAINVVLSSSFRQLKFLLLIFPWKEEEERDQDDAGDAAGTQMQYPPDEHGSLRLGRCDAQGVLTSASRILNSIFDEYRRMDRSEQHP